MGIFRQDGQNGKVKMPFVPEGLSMSMVTVLEGSSSWVPLTTPFTSVVVVKGGGLVQVLSTWDTALVERVEGVTDTKVRLEGLDKGSNTFLVVSSESSQL